MSEIKQVKIEKIVNRSLGLAHTSNNKVIFIPYVLQDEVVEAEIVYEKQHYAFGKVKQIIVPSVDRIPPLCPLFEQCGGCDLQFVHYQAQLNMKKEILVDFLNKNGFDLDIKIIPSQNIWHYRNSAVFHKKNQVGFYAKKSHRIVPIDKCFILQEGLVDFAIESAKISKTSELKVRVGTEDDFVSSVSLSKNNIFKINNIEYTVWIKNFFQVNTEMIHSWLNTIYEFLSPHKEDIILDLFSGVGLITLYIAQFVQKIYGIELERSSVKRAIFNSKQNHIHNAYFFAGSTEKHIEKINHITKIIIDPPRTGMNSLTINAINQMRAEKIVYVSCYPATFFRDIKKISNMQLRSIAMIDMFPQTSHFEIIGLLEKK